MIKITINYSEIKTIDDLRELAGMIKKGIISKPNISKLSRDFKCDRKTIRKRLNGEVPKKTRNRKKYLDGYRDTIIKLLTDKYRQFDYYKHLYQYLVREYNMTCSYSTLKKYIQNDEELRKFFKEKQASGFTERFETREGEQAQFDLKEDVTVYDRSGNKTRINIAVLVLGFSRYTFKKVIPDKSYESVVMFLAQAFEHIGGVPKQLVIDNIKCLVDTPRNKGNEAIINTRFIEFAKNYGFKILPCMPYRAKTKGKVETKNKMLEQIKNYNGTYTDLSDVHKILETINEEYNSSVSQATGLQPEFLLKKERAELSALPSKEVCSMYYFTERPVKVSNESLITYKSNKYSLPKEFIGLLVQRIVKNNRLYIYHNTKIVTIHQISDRKLNIKESHNLRYDPKAEGIADREIRIDEMENLIYDNI